MGRALVIDDSATMRSILGRMLHDLGYTVEYAGHGGEGLKKVRGRKFDVILVDWNMPEMDGLTFVRTLRASEGLSTRCVMVTTETEVGRVVDALASGADEYIMKPFSRDVVADKLRILGMLV